jgi:hypothetical protein
MLGKLFRKKEPEDKTTAEVYEENLAGYKETVYGQRKTAEEPKEEEQKPLFVPKPKNGMSLTKKVAIGFFLLGSATTYACRNYIETSVGYFSSLTGAVSSVFASEEPAEGTVEEKVAEPAGYMKNFTELDEKGRAKMAKTVYDELGDDQKKELIGYILRKQ